jgi:ADP-ribose pyrophosphatase
MHIKRVEKLTNERWLNLFAADFEHKGHTGRWIFASRQARPHSGRHCDAVLMVAVLRNPGEPARLVLIREFRIPVGDYVIGLPAGLIEPGEAIEATVRREMLEETGLEVTAIERITPPLFSTSGMTDEAAAMAFIEVRGTADAVPQLEASEDLEVLLLDYEQVCRLCDDREANVDAKAWTTLYMYRQMGKLG